LENSASAEDALLKSALLFKTGDGESGQDLLISKRSEQLRDIQAELAELVGSFEGLMLKERKRQRETKSKSSAEPGIRDLYNHFKRDITKYNSLGDEEASGGIRKLLLKAEKAPTSIFPELKKASDEQRVRLINSACHSFVRSLSSLRTEHGQNVSFNPSGIICNTEHPAKRICTNAAR